MNFVNYRPKLEGVFRNRFYSRVAGITSDTETSTIEKIIADELEWVEKECLVNIIQRNKYRAVWIFLRDLIRAQWKPIFIDGVLELFCPNVDNLQNASMSEKKEYMKTWMKTSRLEKLKTYEKFITYMEDNGIDKLIASGSELYSRLQKAKSDCDIHKYINPYLQLINENDTDKFTGLKLSEIWRYFRLTWATPSENTPGRTLQYLIRDAAHPNHAIMGIASLENCAVQITPRDNFLGWDYRIFIAKLSKESDPHVIKKAIDNLNKYLDEGISGIYYADMISKDEMSLDKIKATVKKLNDIAFDASENRKNLLIDDLIEREDDRSDLGKISLGVENQLYRKKRAEQLAKYLMAKIALSDFAEIDENYVEKWQNYCLGEECKSVVRNALLARKVQHIGTSMMELNVCGAIHPYNEILSGKLVALLALSPQMVTDYKERYSTKKSEIASRLKKETVIRPADLVYVGTTSLYSVGSSQYNRLKIPNDIFNSDFQLEWKQIGSTEGYGSMHISRATTQCMQDVLHEDYSKINRVFGEGTSPKMRMIVSTIKDILEVSSEEASMLSKHAMKRLIFAGCLISNINEYLLGFDEKPKYIYNLDDSKNETQKIIDFWLNRWLKSRLNYEPALNRIKEFNKKDYLLKNEISGVRIWQYSKLKEETDMSDNESDSKLDFVRNLYKGSSLYADYSDIDILKSIHVTTDIDEKIFEVLESKRSLILTGNAGDGKTHLIRMLMPRFIELPVAPKVILDASQKTEDELYEEWKNSFENDTPLCMAINAAVLHSLYVKYSNFEPIREAYLQMENGLCFDDSSLTADYSVVYDLSRRNVLSKDIVNSTIDRLLSKENYEACRRCKNKKCCDVSHNRKCLDSKLFRNRLMELFNRIHLQGYHTTLRELMSFFSYLIFGNRNCNELMTNSQKDKNSITELIYNGKGKLFDEIRNGFDPVRVSHPFIDEKIIDNSMDSNSWDDVERISEGVDVEDIERFNILKRKFYFFNKGGSYLLNISDDFVSNFDAFLKMEEKSQIKDIISKINKFYSLLSNTSKTSLSIWQGFRYDFSARRIMTCAPDKNKSLSDFKIIVPRLSRIMNDGITYQNNYVLLSLKENSKIYLKVDFELYSMLLHVEAGIPMLYMENDTVKKLWSFSEKLNEYSDDIDKIDLFDVKTKSKLSVQIDLDDKKFIDLKEGNN